MQEDAKFAKMQKKKKICTNAKSLNLEFKSNNQYFLILAIFKQCIRYKIFVFYEKKKIISVIHVYHV